MTDIAVLVIGERVTGDAGVEMIDPNNLQDFYRVLHCQTLSSLSLPWALRGRGFYAFCDDEALLREPQPKPNRFARHLGHERLLGAVMICRTDDMGETLGLTPEDVRTLTRYLSGSPSLEAHAMADEERAWLERNPSGFEIRELLWP